MTLRYELKYAVDILDAPSIVSCILMHPASFTKAYEDRQVNNIYLDSPNFQCFHQNVEGHPQRKKMRLRWYGNSELPIGKSVLEIKNKNAELGWKDSFPLNGQGIDSSELLLKAISKLGDMQSDLTPTLHNTYHRSYYISQDGYYRLTIDTQQTFKMPFSKMHNQQTTIYPVIVELKFDKKYEERAREITDYLPFRQTKNSKYTNGVSEIWF